jgi:hypothetical protein
MKLLSVFAAFAFLAFTTSCATSAKDICAQTDWKKIGSEDAANGKTPDTKSMQACKAYIDVNKAGDAYVDGYADGAKKFCNYEFGIEWGRQGKSYSNICPKNLENKFLEGYAKGRQEFDQAEKDKVQKQILSGKVNPKPLKCTFNSDCKLQNTCEESLCKNTLKKCSADSDCEISGSCSYGECKF